MKHHCSKCSSKAVWYYAPWTSSKVEEDNYFCDNHVSRGCSCNVDPDTEIEDQDWKGRLLPCCEYDYSVEGFDIEKEDEEYQLPPHKKDWQ